MAKQGINTGTSPNDGLGDSLLSGAIKINSNFSEIYTTFGNGTNLVSYVNTAGVATYAPNAGVATYATNAGIATYATTAGISTVAQGLTGTPNINVGVATATSFVKSGGTSSQFLKADGSVDTNTYLTTTGSGTNLTGIVTSIVAGTNVTISGSTGQVTINASGGSTASIDLLEVMLFS
jgi:hypothetical protein